MNVIIVIVVVVAVSVIVAGVIFWLTHLSCDCMVPMVISKWQKIVFISVQRTPRSQKKGEWARKVGYYPIIIIITAIVKPDHNCIAS